MCVCLGILESAAIVAGSVAAIATVADTFRGRRLERRTGDRRESEAPALGCLERRGDDCGRRATDELRADCREACDAFDSARARLEVALARALERRRLEVAARRTVAGRIRAIVARFAA